MTQIGKKKAIRNKKYHILFILCLNNKYYTVFRGIKIRNYYMRTFGNII